MKDKICIVNTRQSSGFSLILGHFSRTTGDFISGFISDFLSGRTIKWFCLLVRRVFDFPPIEWVLGVWTCVHCFLSAVLVNYMHEIYSSKLWIEYDYLLQLSLNESLPSVKYKKQCAGPVRDILLRPGPTLSNTNTNVCAIRTRSGRINIYIADLWKSSRFLSVRFIRLGVSLYNPGGTWAGRRD